MSAHVLMNLFKGVEKKGNICILTDFKNATLG